LAKYDIFYSNHKLLISVTVEFCSSAVQFKAVKSRQPPQKSWTK